ncbi:Re/Si-specific NAD(P)(+) transhydrogenase subunit alpha [Sulfidibacter corallicola]|uniref:NAD(P) transhydrogenase subunit alpha part 1 n=1 Tax=Sulfidibacter corallicola TaxID=2818388 RepID=A0A8A4TWM4_SULCO|nr:Re/Si-specific NAD(P)(+) transhydrogenase subunit alpha [Sulfidibacter corallicola]QTD53890.1 Re/Si-specific NAD(P)(+) transhydrogenase subunit alpha [Sulfidibacter corallicola]
MAQLFFPKEIRDLEHRIAATPETVKKLIAAGYQVSVEAGAGEGAFISDDNYTQAGATVGDDLKSLYEAADIVVKIQAPQHHPGLDVHEAELLREGSTLVASIVPQNALDAVRIMMDRKVSAFSMNLIPRITIAQKMDTLSSQASLAGYKAVLLAANQLGKYFPLLMTAAGTITPSKVVILGAGVAGLQAIATAHRLGAKVEAFDIRAVVKEQVESLGAKFIDIPVEDAEDAGGYAKEQSEAAQERQRKELTKRLANADVAITTALIPGRPAPLLITEEMVAQMPAGSVIVDMAVEQGGNCALSEPGKTVVKEGVTIIGELNIPSLVPIHASQLYARNVLNFFTHLTHEKEFQIDTEEAITDGSLLTHEGECRHELTRSLLEEN